MKTKLRSNHKKFFWMHHGDNTFCVWENPRFTKNSIPRLMGVCNTKREANEISRALNHVNDCIWNQSVFRSIFRERSIM